MVIFNSAESQMAQLIQELIIGRIEDKLADLALRDFVLGKKAPYVKAVSTNYGKDGLDLRLDVEYEGDASFFLAAMAGLRLGRMATKLRVNRFDGQVLLRLTDFPSSRILCMISELPTITFSLEYEEQTLERLSNVLILVISSLVRNRAVFPNYQPLIFRPEAATTKDLLFIPLWKSTRRFVRVRIISVKLEKAVLERVGTLATMSCVVGMGTVRERGEEFQPEETIPLMFSQQFALTDIEVADIYVSLLQRRRRYSKRTVLFQMTLPVKKIPQNVLYPLETSKDGFSISWEVFICTDPLTATDWKFSANLKLTEQPLLEGGVNWNNLKIAWYNFTKANQSPIPAAQSVDLVLAEQHSAEDLLTPHTLGETRISRSMVDLPMRDEDFEKSFDMIPKSSEDIEDVNISFADDFGTLSVRSDSRVFSFEYARVKKSGSWENLRLQVIWNQEPAMLTINDCIVMIFTTEDCPLFIAGTGTLESISTRIDNNNNGYSSMDLRFAYGRTVEMHLLHDDAALLLRLSCTRQKPIHSFPLESSRNACCWRIGCWSFLVLRYESDQLQQLVVPLPIGYANTAELLTRRLCRRAEVFLTFDYELLTVSFTDVMSFPSPHKEVVLLFSLFVPDDSVCILSCYLKRTLPIPGRLFLTPICILFQGVSDRKLAMLPKSVGSGGGWHPKTLMVRTSKAIYEFTQVDTQLVKLWCTRHSIPWIAK
ncbi:hypothetical protein PSACC_02181 [Paramicrosporidium saccamoebae]|uniref:SMP-LTD domain-containing protein n=1 Tax=Paramicrosporidium saccamoebae TaxID=1246581 RepID=A0A2H9TJW9_9FUNG|nr:hypothetical protein PSACC_02181 [Paramicrosporidium saccamoebae]